MANIYCAGPLFNAAERGEMELISKHLVKAGHSVFLPHRDGLEFSKLQPFMIQKGIDEKLVHEALANAIFSLDVYKLLIDTDAIVANLNGRVPDEGTVAEAALAWHAGKAVVLYKSDTRSMLQGIDNPMVNGVGNFRVTDDIKALPSIIESELRRNRHLDLEERLSLGRKLSLAIGTPLTNEIATKLIMDSLPSKPFYEHI
jgi:nucleoside 2-deoxyribosyltransferase